MKIENLLKIIFLVFCVLTVTSSQAKTINLPQISGTSAIEKTEEYIQSNNLDIPDYFLSEIKWHNLHNEYEKPFWRIVYSLASGDIVKGGQIIFIVYDDGTIIQGVGE